MANKRRTVLRVAFMVVLVLLSLAATCMAKVYTVGDSAGWDVSADLDSWPVNKNFFVGDILSFGYSSYHTVSEVGKEGYTNCSTSNAILTGTNGNTTIKLTSSTGNRFFISGAPLYCFGGMKLHINVIQQQEEVRPGPAGAPAGGGPQVSPFSTRSVSGHNPSAASRDDGGWVNLTWSFMVMLCVLSSIQILILLM